MRRDKEQLMRELELSRLSLRRDFQGLQDELNVVRKLEKVVRKKPLAWLGGAAATGFVLAVLRGGGGRRQAKKEKVADRAKGSRPARSLTFFGFLIAVIKMLFPMFRPLMMAYATKRMADMATNLVAK